MSASTHVMVHFNSQPEAPKPNVMLRHNTDRYDKQYVSLIIDDVTMFMTPAQAQHVLSACAGFIQASSSNYYDG